MSDNFVGNYDAFGTFRVMQRHHQCLRYIIQQKNSDGGIINVHLLQAEFM